MGKISRQWFYEKDRGRRAPEKVEQLFSWDKLPTKDVTLSLKVKSNRHLSAYDSDGSQSWTLLETWFNAIYCGLAGQLNIGVPGTPWMFILHGVLSYSLSIPKVKVSESYRLLTIGFQRTQNLLK